MPAYDVAVVGLGAMGSAALYHLARRGKRVIGIEQFEPGHDRGSSHGESRIIRTAYFEHPSYVPLVRSAFENWRELERLSGESILTMTGILEAGAPGSAIVAGSREACRLHDLPHEVMDAAEIGRRFPAIRVPADFTGTWQRDAGILNADRANQAHMALGRASGAEVLTRRRVTAIEPAAGHVSIRFEDGMIEAGAVVVCAGPWLGEVVPQLAPYLSLRRQVLCWYRPAVPGLFAVGAFPVFLLEDDADAVYGFPDFAGTGFKCGSHHSQGTLPNAAAARQDAGPHDEERVRRFLERYIPSAPGRLMDMRTCIYTMSPDEDFIIDGLPGDPRVVIASPCSGHGFKFASLLGEVLADLATSGATRHDIARFSLHRLGVT
jgi:sarcosine oxidase